MAWADEVSLLLDYVQIVEIHLDRANLNDLRSRARGRRPIPAGEFKIDIEGVCMFRVVKDAHTRHRISE
jgi:hypothetical protein